MTNSQEKKKGKRLIDSTTRISRQLFIELQKVQYISIHNLFSVVDFLIDLIKISHQRSQVTLLHEEYGIFIETF